MKKIQKIGALFTAAFAMSNANAIDVNYGEALQKSIYFYEAQQAGTLPDWNRVEWRGDSTLEDGSDVGVDLSGGWYDAGDHVKFGFPMAASATMLAWGVIENPDAYTDSGQMRHIKNNLRFVADYFVAAHPSPNVLYGQVGSGSADHSWWGSAEVVHLTSRAASTRPSFAISPGCPGSDLAGETAAALASISMVFADSDSAYSSELLTHAKQLYTFATTYKGKYSECITDATTFYNSWSGYNDELVWSAAWLHKATGDQAYLDAAIADYANLNTEPQSPIKSYKWTHAWDDKSYGSYVLMSQLTGEDQYKDDAERWLDFWTTGYNGDRVSYTPGGLAQLSQWGSLRYAANTSFVALVYSDYLKSAEPGNARADTYYDFAVSQMEYIMGDNPNNIAYQIGVSEDGPKNPHHRSAHGTWADSLSVPVDSRHLLVGALVGGPGSGDSYVDDRTDYIANEVATDYNAGFTSALARLYKDFGGSPAPESEFPVAEVRDREFYVEAKVNSQGPRYIEIGSVTHNHSAWPARNGSDLKFRYWIDVNSEMDKGYSASDFTVSAAYSQASSVSQLQSWGDPADNIYYTEISFAGVDIFPGGQSDSKKEVQFRISLPSNSNASEWDNVGDPSWDNYGAGFSEAPKIALYDGAELVWGEEPTAGCGSSTGINCLPTATDVSVSTDYETSVAVALSASDTDGSISSYTVSSPANGSVTGSGASRTYTPDNGFFGSDSFTYQATDNSGADSNLATVTVSVVEPIIPGVSITGPSSGTDVFVDANFTLSYNFSNAAGVRVVVDGDQVVSNASGSSVTLSAPESVGSFVVEVIAIDEDGNDLDASDSVELDAISRPVNRAPTAVIDASVSGLSVDVDCSSSTDPDGDSLSCVWDFGDGTTTTGATASHTYAVDGDYEISLEVSDGALADDAEETVSVSQPPAGANCEYIIDNEWNTGFVAKIVISNNTDTMINGWEVSWQYSGGTDRSSGWNANVSGSNPYTATGLSWNSNIAPGQSVEFGIQGFKPNGQAADVPTVTGTVCQ